MGRPDRCRSGRRYRTIAACDRMRNRDYTELPEYPEGTSRPDRKDPRRNGRPLDRQAARDRMRDPGTRRTAWIPGRRQPTSGTAADSRQLGNRTTGMASKSPVRPWPTHRFDRPNAPWPRRPAQARRCPQRGKAGRQASPGEPGEPERRRKPPIERFSVSRPSRGGAETAPGPLRCRRLSRWSLGRR